MSPEPEAKSLSPTKRALRALLEMQSKLDILTAANSQPIAIIGMGCRYPGANNLSAYWQLLCQGVDAISQVPPERWDINHYYNPDPAVPGKTISRWGGFLDGLELFDAEFFGISPREAPHIDPRQRLMLEVTWEALEDAGIPPDSLSGSSTGVFIAVLTNDYDQLISRDNTVFETYTGTGAANTIVANRLSYFYDLRGPSLVMDTACSGSLVAIHLACLSLATGESTLALAGGVSVNLLPNGDVFFSRAGSLSPDGRCQTFDRRANGIVRSEGAGLIVLKPLSQALADGDRIYAVIGGSAANQDGRSNGLMAPNGEAQQAVLREAYRRAGLSPGRVQYIEAHGTGTKMGDPIEVSALASVLNADRPRDFPCVLGSVKSNIGHTEAAAGVASVIKLALSLKHRLIPPNLHFRELNPLIEPTDFPIEIRQTLGSWPDESQPLIAGVSGFGFGGSNAHVVLQEAPQQSASPAARPEMLLPLSARCPEALQALAESYRKFLTEEGANLSLYDMCCTASVGRSHHDHRLAVTARTGDDVVAGLSRFLQAEDLPLGISYGNPSPGEKPTLVFAFSGQGSNWPGMGGELLEQEPVFRTTIEACDQLLARYAGWSLLEMVLGETSASRLNEIDVAQPIILAFQIGLAALWQSWGVIPQAIVGQSLGEVAAAQVAGALSLEDAVRIVYHRSRLIKKTAGLGRTAVVGLPPEQAQLVLTGFEDHLAVCGNTSPTSCIISGDPAALEQMLSSLEQKDVFCRLLEDIEVAAHSPLMDPLKEELLEALEGLQPRPTTVPFFSSVTAGAAEGESLDAVYWSRNLRQPFRFADVTKQLIEDGFDAFLEVSPHPVLSGALRQSFVSLGREGMALPSLQPEEGERFVMLSSLGALYAQGYPVNWRLLYPAGGSQCWLPTYPWQRERYWLDQLNGHNPAGSWRRREQKGAGLHPLLGGTLESALPSRRHYWEIDVGAHSLHYLTDHRLRGAVLLPGAVYIEMALAGAKQAFNVASPIVEDVSLERPLLLPEDDVQRVQMILSPEGTGEASFQIYSQQTRAEESSASWVLHAKARVHWAASNTPLVTPKSVSLQELQTRCPESFPVDDHYKALRALGLQHGPSFQAIKKLWRKDGEALTFIELAGSLRSEADAYEVHPVLLDACFQSVAATLPASGGETYLPQAVKRLQFYRRPGHRLWCRAGLHPDVRPGDETIEADIDLFDEDGQVIGNLTGLRLQQLTAGQQTSQPERLNDWLYEVRWQPKPRQPQAQPSVDKPGLWLIFADSKGLGAALVSEMEKRGQSCLLVSPAERYQRSEGSRQCSLNPQHEEDYQRLLRTTLGESEPACKGVIHLWSLDDAAPKDTTQAGLEKSQMFGCRTALQMVQSLTRRRERQPPRLWLVTQAAQPVDLTSGHLAVWQAPVWGFGRVVALEHAELWGGLIDLDAGDLVSQVEMLCEAIVEPDDEGQIAFRKSRRYVARLLHLDDAGSLPQPLRFRVDGSYLVTGGLSGLGLEVARWMVRQGARRLILLGRTELPSRSAWAQLEPESPAASRMAAIRELEMMGASVHFGSVDVADEAELSAFLEQYKQQGFPPLRGVVHSAGIIRDQLLMQMDEEAFQAVLRPKVYGAWHLHRLTEDQRLDFFILFSSMTSLLGRFGQANYAAGNAFLDALAHYRRSRGLPALSINWGPWAGVGRIADVDLAEQFGLTAVNAMPAAQGLRVLSHLLDHNPVQAAVIDADWKRVAPSPMLAQLRQQHQQPATAEQRRATKTSLVELLLADPSQRKSKLESELLEAAARVLRLDPARLNVGKPLTMLGMESIMAVELKNSIEAKLGLTIPMVDLFTSSVSQLADLLASQLMSNDRLADLLTEVEQLSIDEVQALLAPEDGSAESSDQSESRPDGTRGDGNV